MQKVFFHKYLQVVVLGALCTFVLACKTTTPSSSNSGSFQDNLIPFRPSFTIASTEQKTTDQPKATEEITYPEPENHFNERINSYLDTLANNNRKVKYVDGYTILVYSGTSRDQAMQAKTDASRLATKHRPDIQFKQPTYKVKVGRFSDRLEAQKIFAKLKVSFKHAIIIPEKVAIQ